MKRISLGSVSQCGVFGLSDPNADALLSSIFVTGVYTERRMPGRGLVQDVGKGKATRIVHVRYGFEFLGYKIKCGWRKLSLPESKIRSQARQDVLYAYPKEKSIRRFIDQVRQRTKRTTPLGTEELIAGLNPLLRGWGEYYKRAHIRKLFQRLDGWIRRRI